MSRDTESTVRALPETSPAGRGHSETRPEPERETPDGRARVTTNRPLASLPTGLFLAGCVVLAFAVRLHLAGESGLWRDEALFLFVVRSPSLADLLHFLHYHESHPPLFYLLMRGWLALCGDTERSALLLPVLLGALLPPVAWWAGKRLFSARVGRIAALLTVFSPGLAAYSAQVRPYSLLPLLCLLSLVCLWRGLTGPGLRSWVGYVAALLTMLWVHNWAWVVLLSEWIAVGLALLVLALRPARANLRAWAWAQAVLLGLYVPWLPVFLYQSRHAGHNGSNYQARFESLQKIAKVTFWLPERFAPLLVVAGAVLLLWWNWRRWRIQSVPPPPPRLLALWLCVGVPCIALLLAFLLSGKTDLLRVYCYQMLTPALLVALGYGLTRLASSRRSWLPEAAAGLICTIYLISLAAPYRFYKSDAREIAAGLDTQAKPGDLIVITPEWLASSLNYYITSPVEQIDFPHEGREGEVAFDDLRERISDPTVFQRVCAQLKAAHDAGRRIWLVVEGDRITDEVTRQLVLPPNNFGTFGKIRSNQLRLYLLTLYHAPPRLAMVPHHIGEENLVTLLFAEPALSSSLSRTTGTK